MPRHSQQMVKRSKYCYISSVSAQTNYPLYHMSMVPFNHEKMPFYAINLALSRLSLNIISSRYKT